jgi:hypothetical protein
MQKWKCHKVVEAFKITTCEPATSASGLPDSGLYLYGESEIYLYVTNDWCNKHEPQPGGYFVRYDNDYTSYSPAEAFEAGHTLLDMVSRKSDGCRQMAFAKQMCSELDQLEVGSVHMLVKDDGGHGWDVVATQEGTDPVVPAPHPDDMADDEAARILVPVGSFGFAIQELLIGNRLARRGWNGPGQWVELQIPDENSKMTEPYLYIKNTQGGVIPWLASQGDMLAMDWMVV